MLALLFLFLSFPTHADEPAPGTPVLSWRGTAISWLVEDGGPEGSLIVSRDGRTERYHACAEPEVRVEGDTRHLRSTCPTTVNPQGTGPCAMCPAMLWSAWTVDAGGAVSEVGSGSFRADLGELEWTEVPDSLDIAVRVNGTDRRSGKDVWVLQTIHWDGSVYQVIDGGPELDWPDPEAPRR